MPTAQVQVIEPASSLNTSDNVFHNLLTVPTTINGSGQFIANIVVRRDSDGATQGWMLSCCYKNISGTVSAQVSGQTFTKSIVSGTTADKSALSATDIQPAADGRNLQLQVKGLSGVAMTWSGYINGSEVFNV